MRLALNFQKLTILSYSFNIGLPPVSNVELTLSSGLFFRDLRNRKNERLQHTKQAQRLQHLLNAPANAVRRVQAWALSAVSASTVKVPFAFTI